MSARAYQRQPRDCALLACASPLRVQSAPSHRRGFPFALPVGRTLRVPKFAAPVVWPCLVAAGCRVARRAVRRPRRAGAPVAWRDCRCSACLFGEQLPPQSDAACHWMVSCCVLSILRASRRPRCCCCLIHSCSCPRLAAPTAARAKSLVMPAASAQCVRLNLGTDAVDCR